MIPERNFSRRSTCKRELAPRGCTSPLDLRPVAGGGSWVHMGAELTIDAAGRACPVPILELAKAIRLLSIGESVALIATDPAFVRDVEAWCESTGNQLLSLQRERGTYVAHVRKARG